MSVIDDSLIYEQLPHTYGTYQLTKITQQNGSQVAANSVSGGTESIFEISPKVVNFSKSVLQFTLAPVNAVTFNWLYTDGIACIRQLQLFTRSGVYLCDIQDFDRYTNMTFRRETLGDDALRIDIPLNTADGVLFGSSGFFEGLMPIDPVVGNPIRPTLATATGVTVNESQYCLIGPTTTPSPIVNFRIQLSQIKNSILGLNKDLYFNGEILLLRIV